jgi:hypothetical protein
MTGRSTTAAKRQQIVDAVHLAATESAANAVAHETKPCGAAGEFLIVTRCRNSAWKSAAGFAP